jgi:hypothetical protein
MSRIDKLLSHLPTYFDVSADEILAFEIEPLLPGFRWHIENHVLFGLVDGAQIVRVDLAPLTVGEVVQRLQDAGVIASANILVPANAPGITIMDAVGGGVNLHRSLLWRFLDMFATELTAARAAVDAALDQMSVPTADGEWLDEWGAYFSFSRIDGERDEVYGQRLIAEIIKPKQNNMAIAMAVRQAYGQSCTVLDVIEWEFISIVHDASAEVGPFRFYDGTSTYSASSKRRFGRFDVAVGYSLESGADLPGYAALVRSLVERLRAAGTQMRALVLGGSELLDQARVPTHEVALVVQTAVYFGGALRFNGSAVYDGYVSVPELLS